MSDTIERIMVTFFDVIYSSNKEWTETEIRQKLADKGYNISQSQLNRDLNRYHQHFGVERLDHCNSYHSRPMYLRKKSKFNESRMTDAEMHFLTAILTIKEHVERHLPPEAEQYLNYKIQTLSSQRDILQRNVPQHPLFAFEQSLSLLEQYASEESVDHDVLDRLRYALTKQQDVLLTSQEYNSNEKDTFSPVKVFEHRNKLYISGMSSQEGGTNRIYCVSKLLSVENICVLRFAPILSARNR